MAKVFITGSSEGLGLIAGRLLIEQGHEVTLHARNAARAEATLAAAGGVHAVLIGDVSTIAATRSVADQANALGRFNAVIHNVAVGYGEPRVETEDGLSRIWAVNVLAPYLLTALMLRPGRLIYMSSGMHTGGDASLADIQGSKRRWSGTQAYSDTKLQDVLLAFGVARRWPDTLSNAVNPGWAPTRMGGAGAPDDLVEASRTQAWLAVGDDSAAKVSGAYFHLRRRVPALHAASDEILQDRLLAYCRDVSGVALD